MDDIDFRLKDVAKEAWSLLNGEEQQIVYWTLGTGTWDPYTIEEAARYSCLGLTTAEVRRIHDSAVAKLSPLIDEISVFATYQIKVGGEDSKEMMRRLDGSAPNWSRRAHFVPREQEETSVTLEFFKFYRSSSPREVRRHCEDPGYGFATYHDGYLLYRLQNRYEHYALRDLGEYGRYVIYPKEPMREVRSMQGTAPALHLEFYPPGRRPRHQDECPRLGWVFDTAHVTRNSRFNRTCVFARRKL